MSEVAVESVPSVESKIASEAVNLKPVAELKKSSKSDWLGNRAEPGALICDKYIIMLAEAIYHPMKKANMQKAGKMVDIPQADLKAKWDTFVAEAGKKAVILGYRQQGSNPIRVYAQVESGDVIKLDGARFVLIWNSVKATEIRSCGKANQPVVFYKRDMPVAVLCPFYGPDIEGDIV